MPYTAEASGDLQRIARSDVHGQDATTGDVR